MARLFGGAHSARKSGRVYSLSEAAERALITARRENLALAHVAEREGEPQFWFALNILGLVAVEGTRAGASHSELLSRSAFEEFELDSGMSCLFARGEDERRFSALQVPAGELDKYLRWARSVR
jgi:hypothetical protein